MMYKKTICKIFIFYLFTIFLITNCDKNSTSPEPAPQPKSPEIQLSLSAIDFGSVYIGMSSSKTIQFSNLGDSLLTIDSLKFEKNGKFSTWHQFPKYINPDSTIDITIRFYSQAEGEEIDNLSIYSNSKKDSIKTLSLKGYGVFHKLIGGKWEGIFDWGYIMYTGTIRFYDEYQPWGYNVAQFVGLGSDWINWSLSGNNVTLRNSSQTVWKGTLNEADSTISGTMSNTAGNSGTWSVKRAF